MTAELMVKTARPPEITGRELVEQYSATVFRVALSACGLREKAEDIMQEVFLRLVRTRPVFENSEHAKAWLLRVTMNCCISEGRAALYRREYSLEELIGNATPTTTDNNPEKEALTNEDKHSVLKAVMNLPPKQRICVHLFYYEQQSIAEVSEITGWGISTVKSHLRRGRETLRSALSEEYEL